MNLTFRRERANKPVEVPQVSDVLVRYTQRVRELLLEDRLDRLATAQEQLTTTLNRLVAVMERGTP